jgi:hypothetical protein
MEHIKGSLGRHPAGRSLLEVWRELRAMRDAWMRGREPAGEASGLGRPFNGQRVRLATVRALIDAYGPDAIVETGTFLGDTTRFFSGNLVPVYSIEIKAIYHLAAKLAMLRRPDVTLIRGDSVEVLSALAVSRPFRRPLAYLDAHWWSHLPLRGELDRLLRGWDRAAIVIDDFQVPGDRGYGFDAYEGVPLSLDMLQLPPSAFAAFPAGPSSEETGARRGTLYVGNGDAAVAALEELVGAGLLVPAR